MANLTYTFPFPTQLKNLLDPVANSDAATKEYVDTHGGGNSTPGGLDSQVQYNSNGTFAGSSTFTFNDVAQSISVGGLNSTGTTNLANTFIVSGITVVDQANVNITPVANASNQAIQAIASDGTSYIIAGGTIGTNGGSYIARSTDLISWTEVANYAIESFVSSYYYGSQYVLASKQVNVPFWFSNNGGNTFNSVPLPGTLGIDLAYDGANFVALMDNTSFYFTAKQAGPLVNSSFSGIPANPLTGQYNSIVYCNGFYVVVGTAGRIAYGDATAAWTSATSGTVNELTSVVWTGTHAVAVGDSGTILTSTDGVTWTQVTAVTTADITRAYYDSVGARLYAVTVDGQVLESNQSASKWNVTRTDSTNTQYTIWADTSTETVVLGGSSLSNAVYTPTLDIFDSNSATISTANVDVGNLKISGGTANYFLQTDGTGNLAWTEVQAGGGTLVPWIHWDVTSSGNAQVFTNALLNNYTDPEDLSLFYNGGFVEPTLYTLFGSTITLLFPVFTGDVLDILRSTISSTGNVILSTGVEVPPVYFVANATGNNQTFSSSTLESYTSNTELTVFYNGSLLDNTVYTLSGDTLTVNVPILTGDTIDVARNVLLANAVQVPPVYFVANASGNNQVFSNSFFTVYNDKSEMTVFYNGSLLEGSQYSLTGGSLTILVPLLDGDTIDVTAATVAGNGVFALSSGISVTYASTTDQWTATGIFGSATTGNCDLGTQDPTGIFGVGSFIRVNDGTANIDLTVVTLTESAGDFSFTTSPTYTVASGTPEIYVFEPVNTVTTQDFVRDVTLGQGLAGTPDLANNSITISSIDRTIPYIHFDVTTTANNQSFIDANIAAYTSNTQMTVFRNGSLVEPADYTLSGRVLTLNVVAYDGDNIDIATTGIYGGNINIVAAGSYGSVVTVNTDSYSLSDANEVLLVATTDTVELYLPAANASLIGRTFIIKDVLGSARASLPVTINVTDSDTIDGDATFTITRPYNSVTLMCTTATSWGII